LWGGKIPQAKTTKAKRSVEVNMTGNKNTGNKSKPKLTVVGNTGKKTTGTRKKSATNTRGLTDKQEAFAQAIFEGSNFSDAYREAYDASNMKAATIHRQSHGLVNNSKIRARLDQLHQDREQQQRMLSLSRSDFVLKQLTDEATNPDNSDGARVRALELLGKSVALFTDKVETEDKTERDADAIKAELQAKLDRLLG
jgi:hypothetical protein